MMPNPHDQAPLLSTRLAQANEKLAGERRIIRVVRIALPLFGILVLLISLLLPSLDRLRETCCRVPCSANLKSIGQAILLYAMDHNGQYPDSLQTLLIAEELTPEVFICPTSGDVPPPGATAKEQAANLYLVNPKRHLSYIYAGAGLSRNSSRECVVVYEPLSNHKNTGMNVLYGDGHVDWISRVEAERVMAELQSGHNPPRPGELK